MSFDDQDVELIERKKVAEVANFIVEKFPDLKTIEHVITAFAVAAHLFVLNKIHNSPENPIITDKEKDWVIAQAEFTLNGYLKQNNIILQNAMKRLEDN